MFDKDTTILILPFLSERQKALAKWVEEKHSTQKRKNTNESYYYGHIDPVASSLFFFDFLLYEIGLLHDVVEDKFYTGVSYLDISSKLKEIGYEIHEVDIIMTSIHHLHNKYDFESYPFLNKNERSILEANRLANCGDWRTLVVKSRDILHNNINWRNQHTLKYALKYCNWKLTFFNMLDLSNIETVRFFNGKYLIDVLGEAEKSLLKIKEDIVDAIHSK